MLTFQTQLNGYCLWIRSVTNAEDGLKKPNLKKHVLSHRHAQKSTFDD